MRQKGLSQDNVLREEMNINYDTYLSLLYTYLLYILKDLSTVLPVITHL